VRRFVRRLLRLLFLLALAALATLVWLISTPGRQIPALPPIDETYALDQGWGLGIDAALRQAYYYTPIGSSLRDLRYDWLVNLEMPWGERRFADPAHLRAYGFLVDPPTAANPAQLPVGFARRFDPQLGEAVVDVSCAACHTGQLVVTRSGRRIAVRIDGGAASHAFLAARRSHFLPALTASLASTYLNPFKFRRFGRKVLGEEGFARGKWRLHEDLGRVLVRLARQSWRDGDLHPVQEGFGRMDARARLANELFGEELADRASVEPLRQAAGEASRLRGVAPLRYPSLWNEWKLVRPQSAAAVSQPMARALLEALRGGAHVALLDRYGRPLPASERFRSSLPLENLQRIAAELQRLEPPRWPEPLFGRIDRAKAEWGRRLFERHCLRCHGVAELPEPVRRADAPLRTASDPLWETAVASLAEIGTDPQAAVAEVSQSVDLRATGLLPADVRAAFQPALDERRRRLGVLADEAAVLRKRSDPTSVRVDAELGARVARLDALARQLDALDIARVPVGTAVQLVLSLARRLRYEERGFTQEQQECLDGFAGLDLPSLAAEYEARPLAGIWASAPYLHNGSVPTLFQLLSPQDERDQRFFVSPGAFDPVAVGVDVRAPGDGFWFDTRLSGNSNVGHEFRAGYAGPGRGPQYGVIGPALRVEERWALVEYLKLHEDPATLPGHTAPDCGLRSRR
jgi:mono/diheme cytochrome c family protein